MQTIRNRNEAIVEKIKGLLALADDNGNDEESQTAFMMAQKLMLKNEISMEEIHSSESNKKINEGQVTTYKKLYWWERKLAMIISENFRVKFFYNNKHLKGRKHIKRAITFFGYDKDVELAKEMYVLAYDVILFYSKQFVEAMYGHEGDERSHKKTSSYRNSYMRGFLDGMDKKFKEQVESMQQEFGVMVLLPEDVKNAYDQMFEGKKGLDLKIPSVEEVFAYSKGYSESEKVDYTKSTIDGWDME